MSAFADYSSLQTNIGNWLLRDDLSANIPTFIALAEAELNRRLRTRQMVVRSRTTANDRYISLPSDWRMAWNIQVVDGDYPLEYLSPVELDRWRQQDHRNVTEPKFYTIFGDTLELAPSPTASDPIEIELIYFSDIPALSVSNTTNWLLQEYPDLYLYGALKHTAPFLMDDQRLAVWENLFETALASANAEATQARRSGAPLRRRIQGFD